MIQMQYYKIEDCINNCSFFLLLVAITFYWSRLVFFNFKKTINIGTILMSIVNLLILTLLILRWFISKHFPLSNQSNSLFNIALIHLIIENISIKNNSEKLLFGAITAPTTFFFLFANFKIPDSIQRINPLVPALKSNWLMMHVTVMLLSYAALICGSLFSIAFLLISINNNVTFVSSPKIQLLINLDNLSYRAIGLGFPLLTLGILSGSIWANEAWGSYWSWDPKETWALITWITYSIYLHTRLIKGLIGAKPAFIATGGFFIIWICFLGVNLIGKGLHSYGWIF
uniref:Cytochrome c biogenesis protein CcsA n=1 Tax=Avrainvillea sp. HV04061 TaxID=2364086 RepID=A0A3B8D8T1_9CHLO|nr:cytochrome c biogenesis protein ccs1 [Avrainvillea sp. HV04061]